MTRKLKVFALDVLPPGIPLKRPIITAAPNIEAAAKALKVSSYHLAKHPMPAITKADKERALACPGQRIVAGGGHA